MDQENKCNGCDVEKAYMNDQILQLEQALEEVNAQYTDMRMKFKALQDEYNKVCTHRDVLFNILNKIL